MQRRIQPILARYKKKIARAIHSGNATEAELVALFDELRAALGPEIAQITTAQMIGLAGAGVSFDVALVSAEAVAASRAITAELAMTLDRTTRRLVGEATASFFQTPGMTRGDLEALLEPAFGPVRAEMIAVTEVTRASSEATNMHQRMLAAEGIYMRRVWITMHDELVCQICGPLNGQPEEVWFARFPDGPPAHPRCRCDQALTVQELEDIEVEAARLAEERAVYLAGLVQP